MPSITKEEVKKLTKLLKKKKLKKSDVEIAGKLLTKFLIEIVEIDRLNKEIKELNEKIIMKASGTSERVKRIAG